MQTVIECGNPSRLTASAQVMAGSGGLMGIFVASASAAPTIAVWDSLTGAGRVLVNTFTPLPGTFYPMPFLFTIGCFVTIGGTVDCTVAYGPVSG